ncbi:MAG: hypothetical protein ACREVJ_00130 [Gammaproteobacteria bacterium]
MTTGRGGKADPALGIAGLRRAFGDTVAVYRFDPSVSRGSFFGLIALNGAGKIRAGKDPA